MTVSFVHGGDEEMASYRYRAARPAQAIGASLNETEADILIFSKPMPDELGIFRRAMAQGRATVVDLCDVHWQQPSIRTMIEEATALTVNTDFMAQMVREDFGRDATVIPDPYEYEEVAPHCHGSRCLWFGHASNVESLNRLRWVPKRYPFEIVSNGVAHPQSQTPIIPWSHDALLDALATADVVLMPETAPHKSANRTIEAIRRGCFVVAEPHPSLDGFPGIWIGNLQEGVEWATQHQDVARHRTRIAQVYVRERFSLERVASAWRTLVTGLSSISAQGPSIGTDGSTLRPSEAVA